MDIRFRQFDRYRKCQQQRYGRTAQSIRWAVDPAQLQRRFGNRFLLQIRRRLGFQTEFIQFRQRPERRVHFLDGRRLPRRRLDRVRRGGQYDRQRFHRQYQLHPVKQYRLDIQRHPEFQFGFRQYRRNPLRIRQRGGIDH